MKKVLFTVLAATATLVACNKAEVTASVSDTNRIVRFQTNNIYEFDTKAMTSGNVSIWAGDPINTVNASYTISGSNLAGNQILWGVDQVGTETATEFFSVYPYKSEYAFSHGTTGLPVTVGSTITLDEAFNFTVAAKKAAPGTDAENPASVAFAYSHPFAKITYQITNSSDDAIASATISGVYHAAVMDYTGTESISTTISLPASPVTVNDVAMTQERDVSGKKVFSTVTTPGSVTPVIKVTMHSGNVYTFTAGSALSATAGKAYVAQISITSTHISTNSSRTFGATFSETDWATDNETFNSPGSENKTTTTGDTNWPVIRGKNIKVGSDLSGNFERAYYMQCVGANSYKLVIQKTTASDGETAHFKVNIPGTGAWYGNDNEVPNVSSTGWSKFTGDGEGDDPHVQWGGDTDSYITIYYYSDKNPKEIWVASGNDTAWPFSE